MEYWGLFFFILGGFFRRILGTTFKINGVKIHRFWKLVILALLCMFIYFVNSAFPKNWKEWLFMSWAIGWMVRYNSHSHGDYWILEDTKPDEGRTWWIDKTLQLLFGKGKYYNFNGNFVGLTLGYLFPAIMASLTMPNHWFWIAGFTTPLGYLFCEETLKFTKRETEYAEIINGAVMFLLFFLGTMGV